MRTCVRLNAAVDTVRHALTDPAQLRVWFAEQAEVDLPRRYEFWGRYTPGGDVPRQRLLLADDRELRFAWTLDGTETVVCIVSEPDGPGRTLLTVTQTDLPGSGGGTTLTFARSGFDPDDKPYGRWMGWLAGLAGLRRHHELPGTASIWVRQRLDGLPAHLLSP